MYKLYTDKQETFECDLYLEGADLKNSSARILVETKDLTLLFPGTISKDGNCKVPIKKLKGLLGEQTIGNKVRSYCRRYFNRTLAILICC